MPSTRIAFDEKKIDAIFTDLDQCRLPRRCSGDCYRPASLSIAVVSVWPAWSCQWRLSPGMRMRIASTTKPFAALIYMLLCEDGKATINRSDREIPTGDCTR